MNLRSVVIPDNYFRFLMKSFTRNFILDRTLKPVSFNSLTRLGIKVRSFDIKKSEYLPWVEQYFPAWEREFASVYHKKLIEFYTTFALLEPGPEDVFLDAAGGMRTYAPRLECRRKIVLDLKISPQLRASAGEGVEYLESDAGQIDLPQESVDKISCHHSFEHFKSDSDTMFIREVQRLLRPGGRCCIIPIFLAQKYSEVTESFSLMRKKLGKKSHFIFDPTTTLSGGKLCGSYARVYDLDAFGQRILAHIDSKRFRAKIIELRMNEVPLPDLNLSCHKGMSALNRPYRTLYFQRRR